MWRVPAPPANEQARLGALQACDIMDTPGDERFDRITWLARHVYQADTAFISFIDERTQWIKSAAGQPIAPVLERERSICQHIIADGEALVTHDLASDPRFQGHPDAAAWRIGFYAGVPLLLDGQPIGTLCVMNAAPLRAANTDLEPLRVLARIATDEVELFRRNRELVHHSRIDPLTGLANRTALDEGLSRAASRCERTGEALGLVMIDIDCFKEVNDGFGHPAGDQLLRGVGRTLAGFRQRNGDLVARYGGDEFVAVLPGADVHNARRIAERVRTALAAAALTRPDGKLITASIGVAAQPSSVLNIERLIAAADAALYRAKQNGRDRVMSAHSSDINMPDIAEFDANGPGPGALEKHA
ncbi:GGDEF domain-containing protein [Ancylobacter radicis]|uniref:diguanylate cyclase n=1 Tax=Ancylobacter radicis TaxID=2836179 RepID=A0ABS5R450_9HYPH|nr:sensor domain-containing diguanylate cyclase [Ancylobacter radicis]MBS9475589.1 sensor domain-containing diguanylate cyclase [Ancylobacter radicis]